MGLFTRLSSDDIVKKEYVSAGGSFGEAVSYIYMGECIGFERMLNKWAKWEREYASRGFRTVSLDDFVELGGYGHPIDSLLGQRREDSEEPVYHAEIYRVKYLGKITPAIDFKRMMQDSKEQFGTFERPSTKK